MYGSTIDLIDISVSFKYASTFFLPELNPLSCYPLHFEEIIAGIIRRLASKEY